MNFQLSDDQRAFLDAVQKLGEMHAAGPLVPERLQYSQALERDLEQAGFFDALAVEELGPVAAALMVMQLSRLPVCAELSASAFVAPLLCSGLPRPYSVLWDGVDAPAPFLPVAGTVIAVRDGHIEAAALQSEDVAAADSLFAFPMGSLRDPAHLPWQPLPATDAAKLRASWQLGIACEIVGSLGAALDSVLDHVKQRRQFGRPLGAFQALQHRLAECATLVEGAKWLALHAADSGSALNAGLACARAQEISTKVAYDLHQFMGAMGLTLEHPLHRWTYRTKLLRSGLGGADRQYAAAARAAWQTDQGVPA